MVENPPFLQLLSDDPGQGASFRFGDVSDPELRGVQFIPGSHGGENGNTPGQGGLDQIQLTGDQINGVYDVIIGDCKKPLPVRRFVLFRNQVQYALGMDVPQARSHGFCFLPSQGSVGGFCLAV